ncbi:MAG TPA: DUF3187 family protein [Longimicrobiales bacterium]|nr:DUF3187 family protein [Longimicrobiales bacterium]
MRRLVERLALTALALLAPAPGSAQFPSLGPISAEEGTPLHRLSYTPMVEGADLTPRGALRIDLWTGYSNIFEQDSAEAATLYLDMERMIATAALRYGLGERLEIGGRLTVQTDWGGFLDGFVAGFHETLSLGNRNRRNFPEGAYGQTLEDGDGRILVDVPRRTFDVVDVRVFAKWSAVASADGRRALSLRAVTRMPTARSTVGAQRADLSLMALGRAAWGGFHLHGMAGGATVNRSPELLDVLRGYNVFAMFGAERPFSDHLSAVVQFTGSTPILRSFGDSDVDGIPTNLVFGVVGRTAGGWRWEVAMQEDVPPRGPSLDFTMQLGLGRTW